MKRLAIVCIAAISIAGCKPKQKGAFSISGKIEHSPSPAIHLEELDFDGKAPIVLDSGMLKSDGSFTLKTIGKEEALYRLVVEKGPELIFVNDNDKIQVTMDANHFRNPQFDGSDASKKLYAFFDAYSEKDSIVGETFRQVDSLRKLSVGGDSLLEVLNAAKGPQLKALNDVVTNFIQQSSSPASVYYALILGTKSIKSELLKPMADAASARFKNHSGLARLKSLLAIQSTQGESAAANSMVNQPAPDLTMPDVNGKPVSISSFKGKYVLVDFWASWCGPCRQENPNVVIAYNKFKSKNFTVLGVSLDNDKASWLEAIKKDKLDWTHMSDLKQWESAAVSTYHFEGIPFNVLIDPQGKIIGSSLRGEELEQKLTEVLQ